MFVYGCTDVWALKCNANLSQHGRGATIKGGGGDPNSHQFSCDREDFSSAVSILVSSIMLMNAKMASWWALSAGVPSESSRKRCALVILQIIYGLSVLAECFYYSRNTWHLKYAQPDVHRPGSIEKINLIKRLGSGVISSDQHLRHLLVPARLESTVAAHCC